VVLVVAPVFGDVLSTATAPLDLLLPWNLALFVALYGCGALLCREVACRLDLSFAGLCLLGAAYGIYEEALVDRFWFDAEYWDEVGIGSYGVVWHTNVLIATHLTVFHTAVSVVASVLVVERLFPSHRGRPWVGRRGLVVAGVALAATMLAFAEAFPWPPLPVVAASVALVVATVAVALTRRSAGQSRAVPPPVPEPRRRGVGVVAFVATAAHFVLTYAVAETGLPWPAGLAVALAPVVVGVLVVRRLASGDPYGRDGLRVVGGILAFFVVLSAAVGLAGRFDLTIVALAIGYGLHRLLRPERLAST
jgi:hypothetical protein